MTFWTDDVEAAVRQALREVEPAELNREHLGRPFITAYQLAIKIHRIHPALTEALGVDIGGEGAGGRNSLTRYLATQLSQRIKKYGPAYDIEGGQLSSADVGSMSFRHPDGHLIVNSNVGAGYDTSLFRIRD